MELRTFLCDSHATFWFDSYVIKTNQQRAAKNKMNKLKNDKTLLGAFKRLLLGGVRGSKRASYTTGASGTATTNLPDSAATQARLKEINDRKARLAAAVTKVCLGLRAS